jgi:hypothetical protein
VTVAGDYVTRRVRAPLAGGKPTAPTADDSQTASAGDTGSIRINCGSTVVKVPEGITANPDSG